MSYSADTPVPRSMDLSSFNPQLIADFLMKLNQSPLRTLDATISLGVWRYFEDRIELESIGSHTHHLFVLPYAQYTFPLHPILHRHDYYEMMYVQEGELDILEDNGVKHYQKGDLYLMSPSAYHAEFHQSCHAVVYLCISKDFILKKPVESEDFYPPRQVVFRDIFEEGLHPSAAQDSQQVSSCSFRYLGSAEAETPVPDLLRRISQEIVQMEPGAWLILYGLFSRLMSVISDPKLYEISTTAARCDGLFEQIVRYIEEHPGRILRSDIAASLHYHEDYLNRIFRNRMGTSLSAYCRLVNMHRAADLLVSTDTAVRGIAEQLGFENPSQFYRQFRTIYGMSPGEFRENMRGKESVSRG